MVLMPRDDGPREYEDFQSSKSSVSVSSVEHTISWFYHIHLLQGLPQLQNQENYLTLEIGKSHWSWSVSGLSWAFISDIPSSAALRKQLMEILELALWVPHKNSTSSISIEPYGKANPWGSIMTRESEQHPPPGCSRAAWSQSDKDGTKE